VNHESRQPLFDRVFRALIVGFVLISCLRVWLGPTEVLPRAQAQIPDAGAQRVAQIQASKETNRLLGEILSTLRKGTLNVRQVSTDNNGERAPEG
jgi:hypothetical protein